MALKEDFSAEIHQALLWQFPLLLDFLIKKALFQAKKSEWLSLSICSYKIKRKK